MAEESKKYLFQAGDESTVILHEWWKGLEHDRGERAALRRAKSPAEVVFSPTYHQLLHQLQQKDYTVYREALAVVAGLSAHVKEDTGSARSLAEQMASPKSSGSGARISGLRFRRLLAIEQREELYPLMIRVIRLLDKKVNLVSMANSVYYWGNERTRKNWAYDYYKTAPAEK